MSDSIVVSSPVQGVTPPSNTAEPVPATPAQPVTDNPAVAPPAPAKTLELGQNQQRPAWLPPEYKTPEDFRKAHDDLRAKMSGKADEKVLVSEQDLQGYMQEVVGSGTLSDGSRRALRARGFTDALIDQHVMGLQAIRENQMSRMFNLAGGQERFQQMAQWAGANLSPAEQTSYNVAVNSGNPEIVAMAVQGLKARYELANGGAAPEQRAAPVRLAGGAPSGAMGVRTFGSMQEQVKAQADPRYTIDPIYRREVEKMIDASIRAGKY